MYLVWHINNVPDLLENILCGKNRFKWLLTFILSLIQIYSITVKGKHIKKLLSVAHHKFYGENLPQNNRQTKINARISAWVHALVPVKHQRIDKMGLSACPYDATNVLENLSRFVEVFFSLTISFEPNLETNTG